MTSREDKIAEVFTAVFRAAALLSAAELENPEVKLFL
jgi:hypothetical protein